MQKVFFSERNCKERAHSENQLNMLCSQKHESTFVSFNKAVTGEKEYHWQPKNVIHIHMPELGLKVKRGLIFVKYQTNLGRSKT